MGESRDVLAGFSWGIVVLACLFAFGIHTCTGCEGNRGYRDCVKKCVSPTEYCGAAIPGQDPVKCMEACVLPKNKKREAGE